MRQLFFRLYWTGVVMIQIWRFNCAVRWVMKQKPDVALKVFTKWKWDATHLKDPEWRETYTNATYNLERIYRERHGLTNENHL